MKIGSVAFCVFCALVIAVAGCGGDNGNGPNKDCGDGVCNGPNENCETCWDDCACGSDEICVQQACYSTIPVCGDGVCSEGEEETCRDDCPLCGDGTCTPKTDPALTEDCSTCPQDCACTGDQVCRSWEALLGPSTGCGNDPDDPTRYCGSICGSPNPLIDAIPGRWRREPDTGDRYYMVVDPGSPTCDIPGHEAGDACVSDTGAVFVAVLSGARLFMQAPPAAYFLEGQVLEEGRRIEYDAAPTEVDPLEHYAWVKE